MSRFGTSAARMSPNLCRQWISLELSRTPHHIQAPIQAIQGHHCASKVLFNAQFQGFINTLRNQSSAPIKGITSPSEALQKDGNEDDLVQRLLHRGPGFSPRDWSSEEAVAFLGSVSRLWSSDRTNLLTLNQNSFVYWRVDTECKNDLPSNRLLS
ncbi:uncharacterized protein LOC132200474 isoform X3 [Neocloeon triangulifer]|nr:uncharacterized protein LOC132200474 isoform X3 [Neocloeon triangulifer]